MRFKVARNQTEVDFRFSQSVSCRGTGPYVGHQQLYSVLEENFDFGMDMTRRRNVLQTAMQAWQQVRI
jgi:hypothetical protein